MYLHYYCSCCYYYYNYFHAGLGREGICAKTYDQSATYIKLSFKYFVLEIHHCHIRQGHLQQWIVPASGGHMLNKRKCGIAGISPNFRVWVQEWSLTASAGRFLLGVDSRIALKRGQWRWSIWGFSEQDAWIDFGNISFVSGILLRPYFLSCIVVDYVAFARQRPTNRTTLSYHSRLR